MHQVIASSSRRPRSWRWFAAILSLLAVVAALRSIVIVDQAETVYLTEFGRPVRLIREPGLYFKWPHHARQELRQAAPGSFSPAARDAHAGQEEPGSRLVSHLADRSGRSVLEVGPDDPRRLRAARGHGCIGHRGRAGGPRSLRPRPDRQGSRASGQ